VKRVVVLLATMALAMLAASGAAGAIITSQPGGGRYQNLEPGERADLDERVPVNFVFVGYEPDDVSAERFLSGLPREYKPIVRTRYVENESVKKSLLGLNYTYDYNVRFADGDYEKRFFGYLSSIARPAPLTDWQLLYNGSNEKFCNDPPNENPVACQENGVRDVKNNHHIDAPSVERWLAENPPTGVDTERNTVFFINWWGDGTQPRQGFKHHVYTKTGEPDPDTGYDFGEQLDSRKIIAWGALQPTTRRAASAPPSASGSTTSRQVPNRSPTTGTWTTPTLRATAPKTTACPPSGSTSLPTVTATPLS
jgi:hypothetical protein